MKKATKSSKTSKAIPACLHDIARKVGFETLETRKSDSLDFHDVAVWTLRDALLAAYEAGRNGA